jgi:hypothetical protein
MKQFTRSLLVLLATSCLAGGLLNTHADEPTNRFGASLRVGFNIAGKFKGLGNGLFTGGMPVPRLTPDGDTYNYDDGYILTDSSGNFGGETWYVGYDDSATQISGDQLLLSRSTVSANGSSSDQDADLSIGFEFQYQRQLGFGEKWAWGLEAALNFQPIQFEDTGDFGAAVTRTTDAYAFASGTTPPSASPSSPYQGSYGGPGFLVGDSVVGTTTQTLPNGATFAGRYDFDGNLWGMRLGLYAERGLSQRWLAALSGGLATGWLSADVSWSENATLPGGGTATLRGSDDDSDFLFGFYLGATAAYDLGKDWSAVGGVQYQFLGEYENNFAGRTAEVNFSGGLFVTLGISKTT